VGATLRVRLTHAQIRRWINDRGDWDYEQWDDPANQIQLAGTHLLFSVACLGGLQRLGVHYSPDEREAVMHMWRYVGWLIGIDDALLPATESDAWRLLWLMAATELHPDEDSTALAQALLTSAGLARAPVPPPVMHAGVLFNAALSRYLLGDDACDTLGLPRSRPANLVVRGLVQAVSLAEVGRRAVPGLDPVVQLLGQRHRERLVAGLVAQLGGDPSYTRNPG
jgi:hypothetical protein